VLHDDREPVIAEAGRASTGGELAQPAERVVVKVGGLDGAVAVLSES
jgi:hypothetical protein